MFDVHNIYLERPFEEVIVLDGLGMFVRKKYGVLILLMKNY